MIPVTLFLEILKVWICSYKSPSLFKSYKLWFSFIHNLNWHEFTSKFWTVTEKWSSEPGLPYFEFYSGSFSQIMRRSWHDNMISVRCLIWKWSFKIFGSSSRLKVRRLIPTHDLWPPNEGCEDSGPRTCPARSIWKLQSERWMGGEMSLPRLFQLFLFLSPQNTQSVFPASKFPSNNEKYVWHWLSQSKYANL